jgi:hypothetical protein
MNRSHVALALIALLLAACAPSGGTASLSNTHVHGLAVDRADSGRVYIATHNGLLAWQEGQGLTNVGSSRDDFMGFSVHPADPQVLFRSGHPLAGGNLGFQKSTDSGESWEKVSDGSPAGPADVHAMAIHPANPDHIYGWVAGRIHRSLDGGRTWTGFPEQVSISSIAGDPGSDRTVYAGGQNGLLISADRGETWTQVPTQEGAGPVFDIEPDPRTASLLLALQDRRVVRLSRSPEGGWSVTDVGTLDDVPMHLALDPEDPQTMFAFTDSHALYRSVDGGRNWQKLL